jgi:hypothetical protein
MIGGKCPSTEEMFTECAIHFVKRIRSIVHKLDCKRLEYCDIMDEVVDDFKDIVREMETEIEELVNGDGKFGELFDLDPIER